MLEYGTNVVAGAVPGRGGQEVAGVPVFDTVQGAAREADANAAVVFVPPAFAGDACFEALDQGSRPRRRHHRGRPDAGHGQGEHAPV